MTGPQPAGGGFRVEVDSASQAIRELEDAVQELLDIRQMAGELQRIAAPAADSVSREAALALGNIAAEGKGSFPAALDEGIEQLRGIVDGLKSALPSYSNADRM
jgi:hypothetical protein